ncbi:hypothetical protein EWM64_g5953 [Hericium alpestre]|uniref:Uncharacterized protein n=1 Tax=Hericium alpestre TaxID=135208 RepID=A0A4Y9ZX21_9AGAM|nr:hypothetical protein EWM64_g5953 [Hericium alpestre]
MSYLHGYGNINYEGLNALNGSALSYHQSLSQNYIPASILSFPAASSAPAPRSPLQFGFIGHNFPDASPSILSSIMKLDVVVPTYVSGMRPRWTIPHRSGHGISLVDFAVRSDDGHGPVLPQKLWQPRYPSNQEELVINRELCDPIFFLQENSDEIGIPILEAQAKKYQCLSRWYEPVALGGKYGDYPEYRRQLQIRDETSQRNPVARGKFAQHVAKSVVRFLSENARSRSHPPPGDDAWPIGPGGITAENVILVGVVHVSAGTWQPILRLARPLPIHASL